MGSYFNRMESSLSCFIRKPSRRIKDNKCLPVYFFSERIQKCTNTDYFKQEGVMMISHKNKTKAIPCIDKLDQVQAAKKMAEAGWKIFPCCVSSKSPATDHGFKDATNDPVMIDIWCQKYWSNQDEYSIGLATGGMNGVWVLDIDKKTDGPISLSALVENYGPIDTATAFTGGGGFHYVFSCSDSFQVKTKVGILPGIDTRGEGGYIIIAPSKHDSGNYYSWEQTEIKETPDWLIDFLEKHNGLKTESQYDEHSEPQIKDSIKTTAYGQKVLDEQCLQIQTAPEGQRNSIINTACCVIGNYIAGGEINEDHAREMISSAVSINGIAQEEQSKTEKTIESGLNRGMKTPKHAQKKYDNIHLRGKKIDNTGWISVDYIKYLEDQNFSFRLNTIIDDVELNGIHMTDLMADRVNVFLYDTLKKHVGSALLEKIINTAAMSNAYHPVLDYFKSLDYRNSGTIDALISHFETNDDDLFSVYLKKWLIAAVAKAYHGIQTPMLVLDGRQNLGKSAFSRWLCPPILKGRYYDGPIRPDNKDDLLMLIENLIWEASELGSTTRKADREGLKQFITHEGLLKVRPPYAKKHIEKPPLASFIGTINNEAGFINDPTGSRRFNVITLKHIDWNYEKKILIDDLWAEAHYLYKNHYDYHLTQEEVIEHDKMNANYHYETHIDSLLDKFIIITNNPADMVDPMTVTDFLLSKGADLSKTKIMKKASEWMQRHDIERPRPRKTDGARNKVYAGIRIRDYA